MKLSAALLASAAVACGAPTACSDDGSTVDYAPTPTITDTTTMPSSKGRWRRSANEIVISTTRCPPRRAPGAQVNTQQRHGRTHGDRRRRRRVRRRDRGRRRDRDIDALLHLRTYPFHCTYHPNMHGDFRDRRQDEVTIRVLRGWRQPSARR
ncbi:hypothetical protein R1X32_49185 [Rhodococcus opacus]|uniref:hypothetical protein n=1 Tax=Rhodococcus opacus TaxID=37919 RepID=UPI0034D2A80D